jgi:hypothetical protein
MLEAQDSFSLNTQTMKAIHQLCQFQNDKKNHFGFFSISFSEPGACLPSHAFSLHD